MLPRLKPRKFYDLVIEVAIVRPGPIQGGMVHPYLRRRTQQEPVTYPKDELKDVLDKTMGVPLFQEQAMRIAMVAAGFTATEADKLRRSMASFRRNGDVEKFKKRLVQGMVDRGYPRDFAVSCFRQIEGFGDYGFPESHAASFAKLVYVSAWLKCHYPAAFAAALLDSQPMGFYAPAQIVRDARQHGVEVRAVDVNHSEWDCTLEPGDPAAPPSELPSMGNPAWRFPEDRRLALRLGFREIKGMNQKDADKIVARRELGYRSVADLKARVQPKARTLEILSRADAFTSLGLARRDALWAAKGLKDAAPLPLFDALSDDELSAEPTVALPAMSLGEQVADDYRMLKLSLKAHPMKLLRDGFTAEGAVACGSLLSARDGIRVRVAGLVLIRQRPGEGNAIFITIEDETGIANVIVWPHQMERYRSAVIGASLMCVEGKLQREGIVTHIVSDRIHDMTYRLGYLVKGGPAASRLSSEPPEDSRDRSRKRHVVLPASRDFH
jgi:error-prone DNA polymerase